MSEKLKDSQLREAHVRMQGQAETGRKIKDSLMKITDMANRIMDDDDEIARLKARIAELETDNLNLIDQLRGQK